MKPLRTILLFFILTSISYSFSGKGSGTKDDPYQITNIKEMQEVGTENFNYYYYNLMNDIDASETRNWDSGRGFKPVYLYGVFDGQGCIIKNLYINRPDDSEVGLFGHLAGDYGIHGTKVRRLGIENCEIIGGHSTGALCGFAGLHTRIDECYTTGIVKGKYVVGGLFGEINGGINNSFSTCNVISENYAGGLFGVSTELEGGSSLYYCYFAGKLEGQSSGGLYTDGGGIGGHVHVNCSYYDSLAIGTQHPPLTGKSYGKTTTDMMKSFTFGWDFQTIWCIDEGRDYPKLRIFDRCAPTSINEPHADLQSNENAYPNPFSTHTTIKYFLKKPEFVTTTIFNSLGEILETLVNEEKTGGEHSVLFNSENYPSGIYFYFIQNSEDAVSMKLVVVH
ncbi:MAG: hypothetical protein HW421_756 [Ignavibacteria bacterium]|nr:hypothetical protein [Ignavibacteria bacterium]